MSKQARRPAAFRIDDPRVVVEPVADSAAAEVAGQDTIRHERDPSQSGTPAPPPRRAWKWGTALAVATGGLVSMSIALAVEQLIQNLFSRTDWLGWIGLGLAGLAAVSVIVLVGREVAGLIRLRTIDHLRRQADDAARTDDRARAIRVIGKLMTLYEARPDTARGRAALKAHLDQVIDGRDLIVLAERDLLARLDAIARDMVMTAAKQVSVVTAISPRALVDVAVVLIANVRMIRRISALYGGRPGAFGFWSLLRTIAGHLLVTGGIAVGESVVQQFVGHGLAARLSARLGEGVINGLLTTRVGLSAIQVCRPLPFIDTDGPNLRDFLGDLMSASANQETSDDETEKPRRK
jgi:putative membrane protein